MSVQQPRRRYRGAPIWGILLVFVGVVLLLQAFDVLPWGLWGSLWRFWPVMLVIAGINIILGRYNVWLVSALMFAILGGCLAAAYWQYESPPRVVTGSYQEPLGLLERAAVDLSFTGGTLVVTSLPDRSPYLIDVGSGSEKDDAGIEALFQAEDFDATLELSTEGANRLLRVQPWARWTGGLTQSIPLALNIDSSASNLDLDLSELQLTALRLRIDAANCRIEVPASGNNTSLEIDAAFSNIEVTVPPGTAARIKADTTLGLLYIDKARFPKRGDYYVSDDFETNESRVQLELDCDLCRARIS